VGFAAITLCVASQRVFIITVEIISVSVRKLLDTSSCLSPCSLNTLCEIESCPCSTVALRIFCQLCG